MKTTITQKDILTFDAYEKIRDERMQQIMEIKRHRRIFVGPYAMFLFENYQTLWWQIHEMLRIEKGGAEQIEDELAAYAPLLPQENEFVATFMLEIDDPSERDQILSQLGDIDQMVKMKFNGEEILATPSQDQERTTEAGRTSSVHFLHFKMTPAQMSKFKESQHPAIIDIFHPNYIYERELPAEVHESLKGDLQ